MKRYFMIEMALFPPASDGGTINFGNQRLCIDAFTQRTADKA